MKILNLYAGIGGNRKFWGKAEHQVTAVELRPDICQVYRDQFPQDHLIEGDAHEFLIGNYKEFDFIWTSPPCQSHSRARYYAYKNNPLVPDVYPDMTLYQEIIFLQHHCKGLWVAENVDPYYQELIPPAVKLGRHMLWSNFGIAKIDCEDADLHQWGIRKLEEFHGYDLSRYDLESRPDDLLRNCVAARTGLHVLECAIGKYKSKASQLTIF
jgi:DNA (cytosine-5)-methyltransferase 1